MAFLEIEEISNFPAIDLKVNVCNTKLIKGLRRQAKNMPFYYSLYPGYSIKDRQMDCGFSVNSLS
jgi:hypothetical protein